MGLYYLMERPIPILDFFYCNNIALDVAYEQVYYLLVNYMKYIDFALGVLKENGCRVTKGREALLEVLESEAKPLKAYDLAERIREEGVMIDTSTVYRILEAFQKYELVHFVKDSQGYVKCQHFSCEDDNHCHHEFICQKCDAVVEVHVDDRGFLKKLQDQLKGMEIKNHYLELSGLCNKCKNA